MFSIALIAVLAQTFVHGASALANAALHHRAVSIAHVQFKSAVASAQAAISQDIAAGKNPELATMPSPMPTCVLAESNGCALSAQSAIAIATPAPPASGDCPNTDCTAYLQGNDAVAEGRIYVNVATTVAAPNGAVIATHAGAVAFRTFDTQPYATIAGSLDSTQSDIAAAHTGDDGGAAGGTTDGTLVHVQYLNASNPNAAPIPGDVWRAQRQNPAADAAAWEH